MPTYLKHDRHRLITQPRPRTSPHLQNHTANTPDINLEVVPLLLRIDDLRCHPEDSALHGGHRGLVVVRPLRDAEVGYLADAGRLDKDIVRLEITVEDTFGVEVLEAGEDLTREGLGDVLVEFAVLEQAAPDRSTRDVFKEAEERQATR